MLFHKFILKFELIEELVSDNISRREGNIKIQKICLGYILVSMIGQFLNKGGRF